MKHSPIEHVNHPLCVAVPVVGVMRRAIVDHFLVYWVRCLVGKDTRGEAGHNLLHVVFVAHQQHIIIHQHVVALKWTGTRHGDYKGGRVAEGLTIKCRLFLML